VKPRGIPGLAAVAARLIVAGVFLAAATPKLLDPAGFAMAAAKYRILSPPANYAVALALPWTECVAALGLLFLPSSARRGAWLLSIGLSALFLGVTTSARARGLDIACGCFGGTGKITVLDLALRISLVAATILGARADHASPRTDPPGQ
jgi:uncharacterized membrane protein YphA (DoxX/SURF4 family)